MDPSGPLSVVRSRECVCHVESTWGSTCRVMMFPCVEDTWQEISGSRGLTLQRNLDESLQSVKTPEVATKWSKSQLSIYRGRVVPDPLVQRLGTLGDLKCGVSISSEARSDESHRSEDASDFS
jgi:hypothetical protein